MNNKFEALEKKLNIANSMIEELTIEDYNIIVPETSSNVPSIIVEETSTEIFSTEHLKEDFVVIRKNILKLIATGQRTLDSASMIDPSDMKAATLTALSQLQQTLGANLELLVKVYKEIANIELARAKSKSKPTDSQPSVINQGTVNNNNVIFSGSTGDLLAFMKEQANS